MRKVIAIVIALISVLAGCSRPWQSSSVEPVPPSPDVSYAAPRAGAYGSHHGRMHRKALDLRSSLEVHRHPCTILE